MKKGSNKEINSNLDNLLEKVHHLFFLTSGQCLIYDTEENQIDELQLEFANCQSNPELLKKIADNAEKFTIGLWPKWIHDIDKENFMKLTHLNCF